jgi:hypothetical protein
MIERDWLKPGHRVHLFHDPCHLKSKLFDLLKEGLLCLWHVLGPLKEPTPHHSVDALEVLEH